MVTRLFSKGEIINSSVISDTKKVAAIIAFPTSTTVLSERSALWRNMAASKAGFSTGLFAVVDEVAGILGLNILLNGHMLNI